MRPRFDGVERFVVEAEHVFRIELAPSRPAVQPRVDTLEGESAVASKWAGHRINTVQFVRPSKSMSQIGG